MRKPLKSLLDVCLDPCPGDECSLNGGGARLVINGVSPDVILFEIRRSRSAISHSCKRNSLMASLAKLGVSA